MWRKFTNWMTPQRQSFITGAILVIVGLYTLYSIIWG
jgi:hypothetical protein